MKIENCMKHQCKNCNQYNNCFKNEYENEKKVVRWQKVSTMKNNLKIKKKI